ncbi:LPXTG-site transpeptidase (sortase) family protein [Rhodococcus sp. OK519]|uniref:class E sortase n=1 Tax=Rhodococcus sp. OK519 TaxID=2135729 RepID=UPI000D390134|nr:LPXTG-site transpeptidase (sortase) family protein [Rhodococcus sp. OK519]
MRDTKVPGPERTRPNAGRVVGELLLTVGAVLLLYVFYEAYWTNFVSGRLQDEVDRSLDESWGTGATGDEPVALPAPALGEGFARVHIPALDVAYAVVEGTRNEDLRAGPGHYPDTQMPGEAGNFALAGHRIGTGAVFQHLDRLDACDAVVVETEFQWVTYRVLPLETVSPARRATAEACLSPERADSVSDGDYAHLQGRHITTPDDIAVVNPLPGAAWVEPGPELESILTLTTCHPLFSNAERMIVHAVRVESIPKSSGAMPAALQE